jgi:uncharacterized membrane protein
MKQDLEFIGMGILLVIMGLLFTLLLGNAGSIISFIIAILIVGYMIKNIRDNKSITL